jgi:hypothetical protein
MALAAPLGFEPGAGYDYSTTPATTWVPRWGPATNVPAFVLVPRAGGAYTAVERAAPWRRRDVAFEGECLLVGALRGVRRKPPPGRPRRGRCLFRPVSALRRG